MRLLKRSDSLASLLRRRISASPAYRIRGIDASILAASAARILRRRSVAFRVLRACAVQARHNPRVVGQLLVDVVRLAHLCLARIRGASVEVPWRSAVAALVGVLYFLIVPDVIPDIAVPAGFIDDAAVVSAVARSLRADLDLLDGAGSAVNAAA